MRKDQRLTRGKDFVAARRQGRSWSDSLLVLIARPNNLDVSRFGFSVGGRVGKAVVRNKIRRRLREVARVAQVQQGWDLVLVARKQASSADFLTLQGSMMDLLGRAAVLDSSAGHIRVSSRAK